MGKILNFVMAELTEASVAGCEVFDQGAESCTSTKESELNYHFIHVVGVAGRAEDGMRVEKGAVLRSEVPK